jgi:hypothetical protein
MGSATSFLLCTRARLHELGNKLFALYQGTTSWARQQAFCFVSGHDFMGSTTSSLLCIRARLHGLDNKLFALYQGTTLVVP